VFSFFLVLAGTFAGRPEAEREFEVAAFALIRGVRDIVLAFRVRELQHAT
jgi:hypothetical protein